MPLSFHIRPRIPIATKVRNLTAQALSYLRPEIILGIFLVSAIFLAFFQITAIGFYITFSIFIIGYFCERIQRIPKRMPNLEE